MYSASDPIYLTYHAEHYMLYYALSQLAENFQQKIEEYSCSHCPPSLTFCFVLFKAKNNAIIIKLSFEKFERNEFCPKIMMIEVHRREND